MQDMQAFRQQAIEDLRQYGITDSQVYLIDLIPLIEIIWADGKVQPGELAILDKYLQDHVRRINRLAGYEILTPGQARTFIDRFLNQRPDPALLKNLRSLVNAVRLNTSDSEANAAVRDCLLAACIDIAASSVRQYPYGLGDRFNPAEKFCFFEILESLTPKASEKEGDG